MTITVSTDGSALGNPNGPMGWAWADHTPDAGGTAGHDHDGDCDSGGATNGTNQIGELCAVLEALRAHPGDEPLVIETDSQYAINCSTKWVHGWKRNGWKNSKKEPVKNADIIKAIDAEITGRPGAVKFTWVKGHAGNEFNEKVDSLARGFAERCRGGGEEGHLPIEGWRALLKSDYARGLSVPQRIQDALDGGKPGEPPRHRRDDAAATDALPAQSAESSTSSTTPTPIPDPPEEGADPTARTDDPHRTGATGSGLTASGRIRITPPPSSSPYFRGGTLTIHGTISFTGVVDADGHMWLEAPVTLG